MLVITYTKYNTSEFVLHLNYSEFELYKFLVKGQTKTPGLLNTVI